MVLTTPDESSESPVSSGTDGVFSKSSSGTGVAKAGIRLKASSDTGFSLPALINPLTFGGILVLVFMVFDE
jgi:hypothetical protein